jgi:hypothetical protein
MGKSWKRSKEQDAYLASFFNSFLVARKDNRMEKFRSDLNKGWFTKWPEEQCIFPHWQPGNELTLEELSLLGPAKLKRKNVSIDSDLSVDVNLRSQIFG